MLNSVSGILKQVITLICGFILPRYMLTYYGSSVNGLASSIAHFLSFISLLDMGVGAVIQANLYKPIADGDDAQVSRIVKSSGRFFRRLAYIFIAYIAVLCVAYPYFFTSEYSPVYTIALILIISIGTLAQYMFGMTYHLLLNADQKGYIQMMLHMGTVVLNTVLSVIMMKMGASVHVVKLVTASVYLLRPLGQMLYVRRHYNIDRRIKLTGEPIKQKWNGFSQHFAYVVSQNIAVVVLTVMSTLENVSVYSVYYTVVHGVTQIVMTAVTGLQAMFGNMIAKNETETLRKAFGKLEWLIHNAVALIFTVCAITILPFVQVYTKGVEDANYLVPAFGMMISIAYAMRCLRIPYYEIIKAAGHFKQTQNGAFIAAGLNIVLTILLVSRLGLVGVTIGMVVAMLYHTGYFVLYLRKNILCRSPWQYIKYLLTDSAIFASTYFLTRSFEMGAVSYLSWAVLALQVCGVALAATLVINLVFNFRECRSMLQKLKW